MLHVSKALISEILLSYAKTNTSKNSLKMPDILSRNGRAPEKSVTAYKLFGVPVTRTMGIII